MRAKYNSSVARLVVSMLLCVHLAACADEAPETSQEQSADAAAAIVEESTPIDASADASAQPSDMKANADTTAAPKPDKAARIASRLEAAGVPLDASQSEQLAAIVEAGGKPKDIRQILTAEQIEALGTKTSGGKKKKEKGKKKKDKKGNKELNSGKRQLEEANAPVTGIDVDSPEADAESP